MAKANATLYYDKQGNPSYYKFEYNRGKGQSRLYQRWNIPEGYSTNTARGTERLEKAKNKALAQFELDCENGVIKNRSEKRAMEVIAELERAKQITVKEYCETKFFPYKVDVENIKDKTIRWYKDICNSVIYPRIGDVLITDVKREKLEDIINGIVNEGKSLSLARGTHAILSQIFKTAYIQHDLINHNPMERVERPKRKNTELINKRVESLSLEQLQTLLLALENAPLKWRTIIYLLAFSGCRAGEIAALKWSCVDFNTNTLLIESNTIYTPETGIKTTTPKNHKSRIVYVDPMAMELLQMWRAECEISEYCFPNRIYLDSTISPQSITAYCKKFCERNAFDFQFRPHVLRHTFASLLVGMNADIATVSALLGHADISTTLNMYVSPLEANKRKTAGMIGQLLVDTAK